MLLPLTALVLLANPHFCGESPNDRPSASVGRPANGHVDGAVALVETTAVQILPLRHKARCLQWGTPRLVAALQHAGDAVQSQVPASPPLGVGNIGRAQGGSIKPYSHSHNAGRDCDLAFYATKKGNPVAADDLHHFSADLRSDTGSLTFDTARNWHLIAALLGDSTISVRWIFVSEPLKKVLLTHARASKVAPELLEAAEEKLHQPSDAPAHDDHFHLRIRCTADERAAGCVD